MLAGIGIFIALTQFPHAFGHDKERATDSVVPRAEGGVFGDLVNMFAAPHFGALIIAAACFAVLLLWESPSIKRNKVCLLYTSDAADERSSVDLGGRRIIKKKKK